MPWARRQTTTIPRIGSPSQVLEINDYSQGMDNFTSNDKMPIKNGGTNKWRLAQDARITTLGEYKTRRGVDKHSDPAGETKDGNQESVTGASEIDFSTTSWIAQKFTTTSAGRLTKIDLRIKNDLTAIGVPMVEIWSNSGGEPDQMLSRTSIIPATPTGSFAYVSAIFYDAPALTTTTDYWIVMYIQTGGSSAYTVSTTTTGTDALTSADSGGTWSTQSYAVNFKQYYSTTGGVKGLFRGYKSDGTKVTVFWHGTTMYSVNNSTGALTSIKTGLSASATVYRAVLVNDIIYYVNEYDGLRKWNFTTESQVSSTNYSLICVHKGLLFVVKTSDRQYAGYSNFGLYETFTSTDFVYVPAPNTGDPIISMRSLNGYLIFTTLDNRHILSGDDNATFQLDEAPDQKGSFTEETVTQDKNFMYYLSDDGVYRSNGNESQLLSENIYQTILSMQNKDMCVLQVNGGRLYLYYASSGSANNDSCYVWNLNYSAESDTVESSDTDTFVSHAFDCYQDEDALLVGSSLVGQVFWQELPSNDYTNAGGDINFDLQTNYLAFGSPAVLKEIRDWQPRFGAQTGDYQIACEYATDLRDNWSTYDLQNVQGSGYEWGDSGTVWGAFTWGTTAELQSFLYVPGEYRRIAIRYKHFATREPNTFLGHTFQIQTRRMR